MRRRLWTVMGVLAILGAVFVQPVRAEDALSKADAAVANVLFDYDGSNQFATYSVDESGNVDIIFARNIPDPLFLEIMQRLRQHDDINSVLASQGGPTCSLW